MSSSRQLRRRLAFFIFVAFSLSIAAGLTGFQKIFSVSHIECSLESGDVCPPPLIEATQSLQGSSLFFTNIEEKLTSDSTGASQQFTLISHQKILPNALQLTFAPDSALYLLQAQDTTWIVSQRGYLSSYSGESSEATKVNVPSISYSQSLELSESTQLQPTVHQPLATLVSESQRHHLQLAHIEWRTSEFIVLQLENYPRVLVTAADPNHSIAILHTLKKNLDLSTVDAGIKEVDLRFKLPVVRTTLTD